MRGIRRILLALLVVVVVAGAAFWYFVLRDTSAKKLTLKSVAPSATSPSKAPTSLAGTWKVVAGSGDQPTVAGYRVLEKFAAGIAKVTATGRTPGVTGSVTVVGKSVTAATFDVDMTKLSSDKPQRDNQIRNRGVQTNEFPKATFTLTAPVPLPRITDGKVFDLTVAGNLMLHGVTKKVSLPLKARELRSAFTVQGSLPIVMKDYAIDPPSIGGFVTVDGNGSLEFLANLAKG